MAKKRNNSKRNRRSSKRGTKSNDPLSREVKVLESVPKALALVHKFRRTWVQSMDYNGLGGFFGSGQDIEINYQLGTSEIRIGGVFTFGPTLPNSAEFTNLFDDYRIMKVICRFDWSQNSYSGGSTTVSAPLMYYVQDFNDSSAIILSSILQYPEVRTHSFYQNGYKPLIVELKPRPIVDIAGTGINTSYGPTLASPWIRTSEPNTPHYGLKLVASNFGLTTNSTLGYLQITCMMEVECRGVR